METLMRMQKGEVEDFDYQTEDHAETLEARVAGLDLGMIGGRSECTFAKLGSDQQLYPYLLTSAEVLRCECLCTYMHAFRSPAKVCGHSTFINGQGIFATCSQLLW